MKKVLKYCLLFLILLLPLTIVGCKDKDNNNKDDLGNGDNNLPTTYSVSITLNNSDYGRLIIDNVKAKYNSGEYINITVAPNPGYYLRSYSDNSSKSLTRQILVNGDMEVVVNLVKGEACCYFGYYVAIENPIETKTMTIMEGNSGTFVKPFPNRVHNSGKLRLSYSVANTPTCFFLKHSKTGALLAQSSNVTYVTMTEQDFVNAFGEQGKGEWIDIVESRDYVGSAYVVTIVGQGKDDACFVNEGKFIEENFSNSELVYVLLNDGSVDYKGFTKVSDTEYVYDLVGDKTKFIQIFKLFIYEDEIYYCTNHNVEYMVLTGEVRTYNVTINQIEYTLKFDYSK